MTFFFKFCPGVPLNLRQSAVEELQLTTPASLRSTLLAYGAPTHCRELGRAFFNEQIATIQEFAVRHRRKIKDPVTPQYNPRAYQLVTPGAAWASGSLLGIAIPLFNSPTLVTLISLDERYLEVTWDAGEALCFSETGLHVNAGTGSVNFLFYLFEVELL